MRYRLLLLLSIGATLLYSLVFAQENEQFPPTPLGGEDVPILFPNTLYQGELDEINPSQRYLIFAETDDNLEILTLQVAGNLIPVLRLYDADGQLILEEFSNDLAGKRTELDFSIETRAWYFLEVASESEARGSYTVTLQGSSTAIYKLLPQGLPPSDDTILIQNIQTQLGGRFLFPIDADMVLTVVSTGEMAIQGGSGQTLAEGTGTLEYTSPDPQWIYLESTEAINLTFNEPQRVIAQYITPTPTPRITATPRPSQTPTPRPTTTPRPSLTPQPTLRATLIPTVVASRNQPVTDLSRACTNRGVPVPRMKIWQGGYVIPQPPIPNILRRDSDANSNEIGKIQPGEEFLVIGGPVCSRNLNRWQVLLNDGTVGWTAEGDQEDGYWLAPLNVNGPNSCAGLLPPRIQPGDTAMVLSDPDNALATNPARPSRDDNSTRIGSIPAGSTFEVLNGPVCNDNIVWWRVNYRGIIGWTGESQEQTYWVRVVE